MLDGRNLVRVERQVAELRKFHVRDRGEEVSLAVDPLQVRQHFDRLIFDLGNFIKAEIDFSNFDAAADLIEVFELVNA